jgi:hypothetical protein
LDRARERTGKSPKVVVTDRLRSYFDINYGKGAAHQHGSPFNVDSNTNLIERFHGTLKARTKVMRGLKDLASAKRFTDGWLVHYNYFRPHESLNDKTPAQKAGLNFPYKNWADVIESKSVPTAQPQVKIVPIQPKPKYPDPRNYPQYSSPRVTVREISAPRISQKTPIITPRKVYPSMRSGSRELDLGGGIVYSRKRGRHLRL